MPETDYKQLHRKQVFQHSLTLLSKWMHGKTESEIASGMRADGMSITEGEVRRDLEWTLELIKGREAKWRGEKCPASSTVREDQMPATVCSQCEDAIPKGEYRIVALAASRERTIGDDIVETTRALTFCGDCAMKQTEFTIVNDFKARVERRADYLTLPSAPGMDAMDNRRAITGHREADEAAHQPEVENVEGERFGAADTEASRLSEWTGHAKPDRSEITPQLALSVDEVRRQTLGKFLADRKRSWGRMRDKMRRAATLFVDGKTQSEIAGQIGVDQGTVSRMLREALRIAGATL